MRSACALLLALVAAWGVACIDLEGAYQDCLDDGRCGTEAGGADGGGIDSGTAEPDAGATQDAGSQDAGVADSGVGDAGHQDGGAQADAGPSGPSCLCPRRTFCAITAPAVSFQPEFYTAFTARPNEVWFGGTSHQTFRFADGGWQDFTPGGTETNYVGNISGPNADEVWEFSASSWFARRWTPAAGWKTFPNSSGFVGPFNGYARVPGVVLAYDTTSSNTRRIQRLSADGGGWITETSGFLFSVEAFCGDAPDAIKAVGGFSRILHRRADGSWYSESCTSCPQVSRACWATGNQTAIGGSAGPGGWVGVLDGGAIEQMRTFEDAGVSAIYGLWGTDVTDDLWAVGDQGAILRRENGTWTRLDAGVSADLYAVFGHASDAGIYEVWIGGKMESVLYYCE